MIGSGADRVDADRKHEGDRVQSGPDRPNADSASPPNDALASSEFAKKHRITEEQLNVLVEQVGPGIFDFDEALYVEENPDVRRSLANGEFSSAMHFFYLHGRHENRSGGPEYPKPEAARFPGPVPPVALRKRVHGHTQLYSFELVGLGISRDILRATTNRVAFTEKSQVLDFGCGCGRVLAYLRGAIAGELVGSDIDAEAIAWCEENLGQVGTFIRNDAMPPLPFADARFDLTYAISVFTHLPRHMETAWLKELARVTKPGGYLLLTTNGTHGAQLSRWRKLQFAARGYLYLKAHTPGLPAFYRSTFHSEGYVRKRWSKFFEVVDFQPKGLNGDQNLVVCRVRQ